MKKQLYTLVLICSMAIGVLSSCKKTSASYYAYQTECINVELDGSQTLKAYGMGRNRIDAATQAKKNAIHDVIFKGISSGSRECQLRPLLLEVNAEEKYRSYFNPFFLDRGPLRNVGHYSQFVSLKDEHFIERLSPVHFRRATARNSDQAIFSVIVRVHREELRQQLISDGILKQ